MSEPLALLTDPEPKLAASTGDEAGFGSLETERGLLPLKVMDVHARIEALVAEVSLRQTFVNAFDVPLEATYIFPLPDRAAVSRFRMEVAGRVVEGVLKEREAARREYDDAVIQGRRAAITEEERPGVFTLRVGNLLPGEVATVHLILTGPLDYSDGGATFRFPLVVAPRYIPGVPLPGPSVGDGTAVDTDAVPDASRISPPVLLPGFPNPVRLSLGVEVHPSGLTVSDLRSSLHAVSKTEDCGVQRVEVRPGERLDRDFILRFRVGNEAVHSSLILKPDGTSREGTFLLTMLPPRTAVRAHGPRDVVFVLDRSGSMAGWKMVAARRALARMVDTLTERDRFTIYAFDNQIEQPLGCTKLVFALDRHRFRAVEFLAKLEARGGTEMAQPLGCAVEALCPGEAGRERILVLVTDGQVGNEDQIVQLLGPRLHGIRVFTLGIDQAVNAAFLKRLATLGGGSCELVESEERLDEVLEQIHRRIGTPVLTGLQLKMDGVQIDADSVVPGRLPDLFAGSPVLIRGRYRGLPEGGALVTARDAAGRAWSERVAGHIGASDAISVLWAKGQIRQLEDCFVIGGGDRQTLERRIIETSLRYNVLCRFTAFVAVDRAEVVNASGQPHKVTQAVELPAGWQSKACAQTIEKKGELMGPRSAKKTMLAKRALREGNPDGRVSRKTQLAMDEAARESMDACAGMPPPAAAALPAAVPPLPAVRDGSPDDQDRIEQLTVDHSTRQAGVESRNISAADHRFRNVRWQYLGSKEVGEGPEVKIVEMHAGDRFLLCTDGLTGVVPDEQLLDFIRQHPDAQSCANGLAQLALDAGSRDNVSCIVGTVAEGGALTVGQCSLVGNYRENNEDSVAVGQFSNWTVCLVADGMGGYAAGEVASKRAVEVVLRELQRLLPSASTAEEVRDLIRRAVVQANEEIIVLGALDPALQNLGCTLVLLAWRKGEPMAYVTNVGDSRCYSVRKVGSAVARQRTGFWK